KTANATSAITVNAGTFARLQLLLPGETAAPGTATGKVGTPLAQSAGSAFTVTVNAVDAAWNLVNTNDSASLTSSDANASLPAAAPLSNGTKNFSLTLKTAGNATVTASDTTHTTITANTSPALTVNPGPFAKLQLLVQGETAAPGSSNGKTGTPSAQVVGGAFPVTINAVDGFYNIINTVSDTVALSSSDSTASLPLSTPLAAGTTNFSVAFNTNGNFT